MYSFRFFSANLLLVIKLKNFLPFYCVNGDIFYELQIKQLPMNFFGTCTEVFRTSLFLTNFMFHVITKVSLCYSNNVSEMYRECFQSDSD